MTEIIKEITIERIYSPEIETGNLLSAVASKESTQNDVARFYADCLRCYAIHGRDSMDWKLINRPILERWPKGLERVKTLAWKLLEAGK